MFKSAIDQADFERVSITKESIIYRQDWRVTKWQLALIVLYTALSVLLFPIAIFFCLKKINLNEVGIFLRFGKLCRNRLGHYENRWGYHWILPGIDELFRVDIRPRLLSVCAPANILTKDAVAIGVELNVHFQISNPVMTVLKVENVEETLNQLALEAIQKAIGESYMTQALENRENIRLVIHQALTAAEEEFGILVSFLIRD